MEAVVLPRTSEVVLDTGLQYYVRNNTEERLTIGDGKTDLLRYDRIAYRCEPGEEVLVPWPVIALYFGDPRSQHGKIIKASDSRGEHQVPTRGDELLRLSVFYGTYEQDVDFIANVVPDVTISTQGGVEIIPPCFDPEGEHIYGFQRNMQKSNDVATLLAEMEASQERQQREIDSLKAQQQSREIHGDNDGAIPVDTPGMP
jgi:hypothetical protein